MIINVMITQDTLDYYKGYDLSEVVNKMLEIVPYEDLPKSSITSKACIQRNLRITNKRYLDLREEYGHRSPKVSLSRLLEYGKDVRWLDSLRVFAPTIEQVVTSQDINDKIVSLLLRAYNALSEAIQIQKDTLLVELRQTIYNIKKRYKENAKE